MKRLALLPLLVLPLAACGGGSSSSAAPSSTTSTSSSSSTSSTLAASASSEATRDLFANEVQRDAGSTAIAKMSVDQQIAYAHAACTDLDSGDTQEQLLADGVKAFPSTDATTVAKFLGDAVGTYCPSHLKDFQK